MPQCSNNLLTVLQIGQQHGVAAREHILCSLSFYKEYFVEKASLEWPQATAAALKFMPLLERDWPDFITEMKGEVIFPSAISSICGLRG